MPRKDLLSTHYYLFDRLGSVVALTDSQGNAVNRYLYDPYGHHLAGTTEAVSNPWQYAGGFRDAFSGYYKFGTRYYDPQIGRWTQPDPSGLEANSYAYAAGNPVNSVDPTGMVSWDAVREGSKKYGRKLAKAALTEGIGWVAYGGCVLGATALTGGAAGPGAIVGCGLVQGAVSGAANYIVDGKFNGTSFFSGAAGVGAFSVCQGFTKIPGTGIACASVAATTSGSASTVLPEID